MIHFSMSLHASTRVFYPQSYSGVRYLGLFRKIRPLYDPVTWYKSARSALMSRKLHNELDLPLFWMTHSINCGPLWLILHHVTGPCKGLFQLQSVKVLT